MGTNANSSTPSSYASNTGNSALPAYATMPAGYIPPTQPANPNPPGYWTVAQNANNAYTSTGSVNGNQWSGSTSLQPAVHPYQTSQPRHSPSTPQSYSQTGNNTTGVPMYNSQQQKTAGGHSFSGEWVSFGIYSVTNRVLMKL